MDELKKFLKGKKTYLIAGAIIILGFLQGTEIFIAPDWVYGVAAALGLASLRAGVNKVSDTIKEK